MCSRGAIALTHRQSRAPFSDQLCGCCLPVTLLPITRLPSPVSPAQIVDDHRSGKIVVELTGRINKCGVISPRFDVQVAEMEKWVQNLLPSRAFGHIVLTTSYGIMDHEEARRRHTGGKILGFFY